VRHRGHQVIENLGLKAIVSVYCAKTVEPLGRLISIGVMRLKEMKR